MRNNKTNTQKEWDKCMATWGEKKGAEMFAGLQRFKSSTKKRQTRVYQGLPVLTPSQAIRLAERAIPAHLRPYYLGHSDLQKRDINQPLVWWNVDMLLNFKAPVVSGLVDGVRYARAGDSLKADLTLMLFDPDSVGDPEYAEYDEEFKDAQTKTIK